MDIENIKKIITEVLSESEMKDILREKIDKAAEEKTKLLFDKQDKEENLEKMVEKRINGELSKFKKILSKYVTETVAEFLSEHEDDFKIVHESAKINYILESLSTMLKVVGVKTEDILECKTSRENEIKTLEQRINNLKEHLIKEQHIIKELQINENSKIEELKDALIKEGKQNEKLKKLNNSLKTENETLNENNKELSNKNNSLYKENNKIIQMGIIEELKSGLSLTESHNFEKCASKIPFNSRKDYVIQLKELKESIKNESEILNEVYPENEENKDYEVPECMKRFI